MIVEATLPCPGCGRPRVVRLKPEAVWIPPCAACGPLYPLPAAEPYPAWLGPEHAGLRAVYEKHVLEPKRRRSEP